MLIERQESVSGPRPLGEVRPQLLAAPGRISRAEGRRPTRHTTGPDPELYDEAALDAWRARTLAQPTPYPMPAEADQMRTLGGIARLLGVDGKTISQYRHAIEARVQDREQRGSRTLYRMREVIEALNEIRRGPGVAADPEHDRRRRSPGQKPPTTERVNVDARLPGRV